MRWLPTIYARASVHKAYNIKVSSVVASRNSFCRVNKFSTCSLLHKTHSLNDLDNVKPLFLREEHSHKVIIDSHGEHSFKNLVNRSFTLSELILPIFDAAKKSNIKGERIALLCPNDSSYVVAQWATWMSGGVVVPLCTTHPPQELEYFIYDSGCTLILYTEEYAQLVKDITKVVQVPALKLGKEEYDPESKTIDRARRQVRDDRKNRLFMELRDNKFKDKKALIIYTSGTTGRPKGVVHTHGSLQAQMAGMLHAWQWSVHDTVLHVLPLHHVHGIVNVLMTPLAAGATCVMLPRFHAEQVWKTLLSPVTTNLPKSINVFMAVPTIYAKLIQHYERQMTQHGHLHGISAEGVRDICTHQIRLMVSGSAALPQPIMEAWERITGHTLLERYGMTEVGMALTNPLHGQRVPGAVGLPFPGVQARIRGTEGIFVEADSEKVHLSPTPESSGELEIKGPNVFLEYHNRKDATDETFTFDGWFKTGDTATFHKGVFRIMGRSSVDIIKSGGYKISALDIERHLLAHDVITDVAVLGVPDVTWGEKIAAVVVLEEGEELTLEQLRDWCKGRIPAYHVPTVLQVLTAMPRNAMGKVNKKQLLKAVFNI